MSHFFQRPPVDSGGGAGRGSPPWFNLLPDAWRRPGALPPSDQLYGFLQEWTAGARRQLDELEGYLLAAVDEPAFAALSLRLQLANLERARRWLDELAEAQGMEAFESVFRAQPGMLAAYQRLQAWRTFLQGPDRPRLVVAYRYLTDPDLALPEGEPYRELHELRTALLDMLSDSAVLLQDGGRRRFWDGLAAFQFRYRDLYIREHNRRRRPDALAPYRAVRDLPAYRLLRRLQTLEGAPVRAGLAELENRLQSLLAKQCPGVDEALLANRPVCTCGFRLDEPPPEPPEQFARDAEQHVWHGVRMLSDPEVRSRLQPDGGALDASGDGGDTHRERMERLFTWLDRYATSATGVEGHSEALHTLDRLLDEDMIRHLNERLRRSGQVILRSLETLVADLAGRDLSLEQLQQAVTTWAFGDVKYRPGLLVRPLWTGDGDIGAALPAEAEAEAGSGGEAAPLPQTFDEWERTYAEAAEDGSLGNAGLQRAFRRFYRRSVKGDRGRGSEGIVALDLFEPAISGGILAGLQRPVTLPLFLEHVTRWMRSGEGPARLVWVDALRYDVWRLFLRRCADRLEVVESGFLWALPPATTAGQMARIDAHGIRFGLWEADRWAAPAGESFLHSLREGGSRGAGGVLEPSVVGSSAGYITYIRGVEQAINEGFPPTDELVDIVAGELVPLLETEPETHWIVFSDHGFTEVDGPKGKGRADKERKYVQGGDSMEEVLVPWARLRWAPPR